jgi:hypothetical protein
MEILGIEELKYLASSPNVLCAQINQTKWTAKLWFIEL